jgi:hypothetical protein
MSELVVQERRLPGIGWRYDTRVGDDSGQLLVIVAEDRGPRHIMVFDGQSEEPSTSVRLSAGHAAGIAALLTGARLAVVPAAGDERPDGPPPAGIPVDTVDAAERSVAGSRP